jgi:hypothetical protein
MTKRDKLVPFILAVITLTFAVWCLTGIHFGHRVGDFDPRADENSEGQCP